MEEDQSGCCDGGGEVPEGLMSGAHSGVSVRFLKGSCVELTVGSCLTDRDRGEV